MGYSNLAHTATDEVTMTTPAIPRNAYTNAPEPHPNLILGSLQLLFWLVFRPSAWANHLHRIDPSLDKNVSLFRVLASQSWRNGQAWRFLLQGFFLLPLSLVASLSASLSLLNLGTPVNSIALSIVFIVAFVVALDLVVGSAFGVTFGVAAGVALVVSLGVAVVVPEGVLLGMALGLVFGVAVSVSLGVVFGMPAGVTLGVTPSVVFGVAAGVVVGVKSDAVLGVAAGVAVSVGVGVNWWRPVIMSVLLMPVHDLLYRMDRGRVGVLPSLLYKHLVFWDEWQYLPMRGLDKHLSLVLERSPTEGQAALNYLSTSRQKWAAQAAQIELDARQLELCVDVGAIARAHHHLSIGELSGPADTLFYSFNQISEEVEAALRQSIVNEQRLALIVIAESLDSLVRELTNRSDKYAARFCTIAQHWREVIARHRQESDNPL
jgi:hypothetical protein